MRFASTLLSTVAAAGTPATPVERDFASVVPIEDHDLVARQASIFTPTPVGGCMQSVNIIVAFNYLLANPTAPSFAATANTLFANDWTNSSAQSISSLVSR